MELLVDVLLYLPPCLGAFFFYRRLKAKYTAPDLSAPPMKVFFFTFFAFLVLLMIWSLLLYTVVSVFFS